MTLLWKYNKNLYRFFLSFVDTGYLMNKQSMSPFHDKYGHLTPLYWDHAAFFFVSANKKQTVQSHVAISKDLIIKHSISTNIITATIYAVSLFPLHTFRVWRSIFASPSPLLFSALCVWIPFVEIPMLCRIWTWGFNILKYSLLKQFLKYVGFSSPALS